MKVVVNGRFLSRRVTGVERYGREILRCLPGRMQVVRPERKNQGVSGHAWEQFFLPGHVKPGEILWSPANTGPLVVANQVLTLHDLSALEHPEWFTPAFAMWYRLFMPMLVRRVRRLVVPSEYVRKKILSRFSLPPDRVNIAPGGVDLNCFHPNHPVPDRVPARYIFFVGSLQPRKNLGVLLQAWGQIVHRFPDIWLVVAGAQSRNFNQVSLSTDVERVGFLGYVPDADLAGLYAGALVFLLPSLDEGFGLPVLEAMACGTPVIAARAGALPEVVGDAGLLFDPVHPAELADILERLLSDINIRRRLAEKGLAHVKNFSWQSSAEKMWEILHTCL
jgi:glycosyltransferase involved in cell wall biosynthesis